MLNEKVSTWVLCYITYQVSSCTCYHPVCTETDGRFEVWNVFFFFFFQRSQHKGYWYLLTMEIVQSITQSLQARWVLKYFFDLFVCVFLFCFCKIWISILSVIGIVVYRNISRRNIVGRWLHRSRPDSFHQRPLCPEIQGPCENPIDIVSSWKKQLN